MPRPDRFVEDPVYRPRGWEDSVHAHDEELDRRAMHDPGHWSRATFFCETCGREAAAQALCPACGDELDEAA